MLLWIKLFYNFIFSFIFAELHKIIFTYWFCILWFCHTHLLTLEGYIIVGLLVGLLLLVYYLGGLLLFYYFYYLLMSWIRKYSTMLNGISINGHLCLVLDFRGEPFSLSTLRMLAICFCRSHLSHWVSFLLLLVCLEFLLSMSGGFSPCYFCVY